MYLHVLLLATTAAAATTKAFSGLGQIRTVYIGRGHADLGCLTRSGQWTTNEAQCGTFTAEPLSENTFSLYAPSHGMMAGGVEVCGVDVATFKCGGEVKGAIFGVSTSPTQAELHIEQLLTCRNSCRPLGPTAPLPGQRCCGMGSTGLWRRMQRTARHHSRMKRWMCTFTLGARRGSGCGLRGSRWRRMWTLMGFKGLERLRTLIRSDHP